MIQFACPSCDNQLQVPPSAAGKTAKCTCGTHIQVPAAEPQVAGNAPNEGSIWDDLPDTQSTPSHSPAAAPHPMPSAGGGSDALAGAAAELRREDAMAQASQGRSSPFNGKTMIGLLMIIGAIVWFFGGLAAGIIFFYPPILLIFGIVTMIKGLLGGE